MNILRELKKRRIRLHDELAMVCRREDTARERGQGNLALHLHLISMRLQGALAGNAEAIRQARIVLGIPWRGKGC